MGADRGARRCAPRARRSGGGRNGGAAYLVRDGVTFIVGVSSSQDSKPAGRLPGRYGVIELYPRVSSFASWIEPIVDAR
jgi:hypothetical protein